MDLVERAKNICLTPKTEWQVIAGEDTPTASLLSGYVVPLAVIGPVAGFIGGSLIGRTLPFVGTYRTPIVGGLAMAVFLFVMAIVSVFIISLIIDALAPTFGGEKSKAQALKVAAYSYTPAWVAGVLQVLPLLGLLALLGSLYSLYLLYLGLPRLMKCPEDKALGYTVVVVVCAIVLSLVIFAVGATFTGLGMLATGGMTGALGGGDAGSQVQFDKDSPLGKLAELGQKMEAAGKRAEAAQASGDQDAEAKAVMEGLGTLFGGGRRVDPVPIEQLKPLVPDTFAGLPRRSSSAERNGMAGIMVSKAEASYGDDQGKDVQLEITDSGGASGFVGLASWANVLGDKEDDSVIERTQKIDGRMVHEKLSKDGGQNEFEIVLGERFIVSARGDGIALDQLKAAVMRLDLARLEALKDVGVQK